MSKNTKFNFKEHNTKQNLILSIITLISSLFILEIGLRFFILPSQNSYGTLFGHELPPYKVIPYSTPPQIDRSTWYEGLIVAGQKVTIGDLEGIFREDSLLGYAPEENMISTNRWWQSNNLGARARYDTAESKPEGQKRVLIFGDSFAVGSRVPQEEVWSTILQAENSHLELLNFGVAGYSMGQSLLRYREIQDHLAYDLVLLMFVPGADLWRDINTIRNLGEEGWSSYLVLPRYILEHGKLNLIKSPYEIASNVYEKNAGGVSNTLQDHLISYDRFYFEPKYKETWIADHFILYKLFVKIYYDNKRRALRDSLINPDSEALQISRKIFETMNNEVKRDGHEFVLILLPTHQDLQSLKNDSSYRTNWHKMVASICTIELSCIDLAEELQQISPDQLDKGYDGSHYGPQANWWIAQLIEGHLQQMGILETQGG